jgi:hypothetical protein
MKYEVIMYTFIHTTNVGSGLLKRLDGYRPIKHILML